MSEVRIHNVQLEPNKHVVIALQKIFGIGPTRAKKICQEAGIQGSMNTKELSEDQKIKLKNGVGEIHG